MQSFELTQPISSSTLLKQFESRFGQTMKLEGLTKEQLEDLANGVRTKIHTITDNLHFGKELKDNEYQKSQMMLDIINQAVKEYGGSQMDPQARTASQAMTAQKKLEKGQSLTPDERKTVAILNATVDKTNTRAREVMNDGLLIISKPIIAKFVEPLNP